MASINKFRDHVTERYESWLSVFSSVDIQKIEAGLYRVMYDGEEFGYIKYIEKHSGRYGMNRRWHLMDELGKCSFCTFETLNESLIHWCHIQANRIAGRIPFSPLKSF